MPWNCFLGLIGCVATGVIGDRELRPPRAGIEIGALYFVRERPTNDTAKPAYLERLCSLNLAKYGVAPGKPEPVADIDYLWKLDAEGALDGIKTQLVNLGLSGSLGDYYEYKITNVLRSDISWVEAKNIFESRGFRSDCVGWRDNIEKYGWAVYQIQSVSVGDVRFSRKNSTGLSADVSAKLGAIEPKLKASIKNSANLGFTGRGLVVSFGPIQRN